MFGEIRVSVLGLAVLYRGRKRGADCLPFGAMQANLCLYSIRKSGLIP
jgi:hypothetical protein